MKDWIQNRIRILRSENIVDLYSKIQSKSLQDLQEPVKSVNYAKSGKNIDLSGIKQTTYRQKKNFK